MDLYPIRREFGRVRFVNRLHDRAAEPGEWAVTGAFMSLDRSWFEMLDGFCEDYVFGHYEDADLCLRSLQAGSPAWMRDLRLWHLEGKSSPRLPVHDAATLVNRWRFASRWAETLKADLMGRAPTHPLLRDPGA